MSRKYTPAKTTSAALWVRIVALVCAGLIALSALSAALFL